MPNGGWEGTDVHQSAYLKILQKHEPRSFHHEVPAIWNSASGMYVHTSYGGMIDFTSGILVANIGHSHRHVLEAIRKQDCLHSYAFPTEIRAKLVQKLVDLTGMDKVFLCSTGSEAVESALRCMWAKKQGAVYGISGANHGRTYGSKEMIGKWLRYDDLPSSDYLDLSGVIFETYLGYNAQFHPVEWVQEWCNWAKEHDIPVCFDEIQAGFGRTGKMFGYEHYGVKPDLIVVGKALSGSLPISAVIGRADLLDAPDDLSSTHSGNPVCCAAALANIGVIEREHLVERAANMEEPIRQTLLSVMANSNGRLQVLNGKGMVWAFDLRDIELANRIVDRCAKKGLLMVKTHKGTLKIAPPLVMSIEVFKQGCKILREAINEC